MNPNNNDITMRTPDERFDLLVDGELGDAERSNMLSRLDHEPEGWRRCALAFLEAQCWKSEMGKMPRSSQAPRVEAESVVAQPIARQAFTTSPSVWRQYLATGLAMAASFMVALVLGSGMRNGWTGGSSHLPGNSEVAQTSQELPLPASNPAAIHELVDAKSPEHWEVVTLATAKSSGRASETFQVPAIQRDAIDSEMLERFSGSMPADMLRAFQESGHSVTQRHEIVPIQMNDGRRLVVPVNHVQIHYVGRPTL